MSHRNWLLVFFLFIHQNALNPKYTLFTGYLPLSAPSQWPIELLNDLMLHKTYNIK